jgi:hypothetical protein
LFKLYEKFYFPLKKELIPCLPSLISSILFGLEEQDEVVLKETISTLDALSVAVDK